MAGDRLCLSGSRSGAADEPNFCSTHLLLDGNVVVWLCVSFQTHVDGGLGGCGCTQDQVFLRGVIFPPSASEAAVKVLVALLELERRRCAEAVRSWRGGRRRRGIRGYLRLASARENHS